MVIKPLVVIKLTALFCAAIIVTFINTSYAQISSPKNLNASVDNGKAALSWEAPESGTAAQYFIYKAYAADANADLASLQFLKSDSTSSESYSDDLSLASESTPVVYYYITAVDASGNESAKSSIVNAAAPKKDNGDDGD